MPNVKNALCNLAMMPMREEPKHRAQMVSMLLFGELYGIVESQEYWHKIQSEHDKYEGWIYSRKPFFVEDD
ncbi:MAG: SH3 domain-containing protein, partial [Sphingobacteriales bacterium]